MKYLTLVTLFYLLSCLQFSAQIESYHELNIDKTLVETGVFKNFYKYDLLDFTFYNGRYENNLKFKILRRTTNEVEYTYQDTLSDAMIFKPKFYIDKSQSTTVILVEVAAEYSWGQEVLIISGGKVNHVGYLDYAVALDNEESLADYCILTEKKDHILMTFDDVPIISWDDNQRIINGKYIEFELSLNGIVRTK